MARLSLKEAEEYLGKNGWKFEGRDAEGHKSFSKDGEVKGFSSGREIVSFVKEMMEGEKFNLAVEEGILDRLNSRLEEVKRKRDSEFESVRREAFKEYQDLERSIKEQKVVIKSSGRKIVTVQRVRNILKKAGYENLHEETTRVRGWHNYYGHYQALLSDDHEEIKVYVRDNRPSLRDDMMKVLFLQGLKVETREGVIYVNRLGEEYDSSNLLES